MRTLHLFARVEACALVALLLVASAMALLGSGFPGGTGGTAFQNSGDAAKFYFVNTMLLGGLPALMIGAPIYFALLRKGRARWFSVILLGVAPALIAMLFDTILGAFAMVCGIAVASMTHVACRRLGP